MIQRLQERFVTTIPDDLDAGVLYVSMPFATAAHLCGCGCGDRVITPIAPDGWAMSYAGDGITLHPSIGNWALPCRSHYWIRAGRLIEVPSASSSKEAAQVPTPTWLGRVRDVMRQVFRRG